jgi:mono/diheme cytochrome c family protein
MKPLHALAAALLASVPCLAPAADADHGRELYESACIGCHGRSLHARTNKTVRNCAELRATVVRFSDLQGRNWEASDIDDVTTWLNLRYYGFPLPEGRCGAPVAAMRPSATGAR